MIGTDRPRTQLILVFDRNSRRTSQRKSLIERALWKSTEIDDPPFYRALRDQGFSKLINFDDMAAVTFDDTIALRCWKGPGFPDSIIFHELVHVAQYQRFGIDRFIHHYVTSWADSGFRYERIILERHAHGLDREFTYSELRFSVEQRLNALMGSMN